MVGIVPQVITEVAAHLRELSKAGEDPRNFVLRGFGPSLLEVAEGIETNPGSWLQAEQALRAQLSSLLDARKTASDEERAKTDELLGRLGNWIVDLTALNEPMTD